MQSHETKTFPKTELEISNFQENGNKSAIGTEIRPPEGAGFARKNPQFHLVFLELDKWQHF